MELTEEGLLDLEIGFLHRFVYKLIWKHIHIEEDLVGKAELMLKELLSSAVKISLSAEERKALLSKRAC